MTSTPMHRIRTRRATVYLAVTSGAASISMAVWGLYVLGGH